jgi:excisionase family DNA binding protein
MSEVIQQEECYLLSVREAAHRLGVSRRTLEREVCRKKFPPPMKIGSKSVYLVSDVERYVQSLLAQREAMQASA